MDMNYCAYDSTGILAALSVINKVINYTKYI